MANRYFQSVADEDAFFAKSETQRQARERYRQRDNTALAGRVDSMGRRAPWIRPDAALSLGKAGIDANNPRFERIAFVAGREETKKGGWGAIGDMATAFKRTVGNAAGSALKAIGGAAGAVARPALRGADIALQAPYEEFQGAFRNITSGDFKGLGEQAAGIALGPQKRAAALGSAIGKKIDPNYNPNQGPVGAANKLLSIGSDESQSKLGIATQQLMQGQQVDAGKGFFGNGQLKIEQARRARSAGMIDGHAVTPGRFVASKVGVIEPGTKPYNLLSGLIDASIAIGADPASKTLNVASKSRNASKLFSSPDANFVRFGDDVDADDDPIELAKEGAGAIKGHRKDVMVDRAQSWLNSESGSKIVEFAANTNDFKTLRKNLGNKIEAKTLVALQDAKTPEEVNDILRPRLGIDNGLREIPELRKGVKDAVKTADPAAVVSATTRNLSEALFKKDIGDMRIAKMMPGQKINLDDHDDAVNQIDLFAVNAELPENVRWARVEQMARADTRAAMLKATEDLMTDTMEQLRFPAFKPFELKQGTKARIAGREVKPETKTRFGIGADKDADIGGQVLEVNNDRVKFLTDDEDEIEVGIDELRRRAGVDKDTAKKLTRLWSDRNAEENKYWIDAVSGDNMPVPGVLTHPDNPSNAPTPHRLNEFINSAIPLPPSREIREATGKWGRLLSNKHIKVTWNGKQKDVELPFNQTEELADYTIQLWKASVLIRPAYTLRVEGESQLRMAGAGYSSLFNHPAQAFGFIRGTRGRIGVAGQDFKTESELAEGVDEYAASLSRNYDYQPYKGSAAGSRVETFNRDISEPDDFVEAWADTIHKARSDELTRRVVGGDWDDLDEATKAVPQNMLDRTKAWSWDGEGSRIRNELAQGPGREGYLTDRAVWDEYVDSIMQRVDGETNSDPEILQAIASGMFRGEPIRDGFKTTDAFKAFLRSKVDEGAAPQRVRGQREITYERDGSHRMQHLDRLIDAGFNTFASKPANTFSRSPMFMQANWNRAAELMPYASREAQEAILDNAEKSKLPAHVMAQLTKQRDVGFGDLDVDEVDQISKLYALNEVKSRLYDLNKRSQFFDMYRLAFPFGDAWLEVLNSWRKITTDNPSVVRRGQQLITGAREADPDADGQGFFYKDPTTGEEMYTMPFSKFLTEGAMRLATGVEGMGTPYSSPVKGLNIFGTVLPGFGPAVQVPAGALLPDEEEWDEVKKLFLPFGQQNIEGGAVVESFWPAWAKKIATGVSNGGLNEKQYNDSVTNLASMLFDQGKYNPEDPEDFKEAFQEAKRMAPALWVMRGVAQSTAPSPPSPEFLMHDQDGRMVAMDYLINDLRDMQQANPEKGYGDLEYKDVTETFLNKYGVDALLLLEGKTENIRGNLPVTREAKNWARSNPELADKFPDIYGYFSPQEGKFDIDAYSRQLKSGERKGRTPEEVKDAVEAEIGNMVWRQVQSQVQGRKDDGALQWKARARELIEKQYPGFGKQEVNLRETTATIGALEVGLKDERLANTQTGKGLIQYFAARDQALAQFEAAGMDPTRVSGSKKAKPTRDWLRSYGEQIAITNRDFSKVWDSVLSREVDTDDEDE